MANAKRPERDANWWAKHRSMTMQALSGSTGAFLKEYGYVPKAARHKRVRKEEV